MDPGASSLTVLLQRSRDGDRQAMDEVTSLVYGELRRLAGSYLRNQNAGHTLQPTALVNEAYLRLADRSENQFNNRAHFFGVAATIMRQILVDHARARCAAKRGGSQVKLEFKDSLQYSDEKASALMALDDALTALNAYDERKAKTIELRYFGGLSVEETAEVLGVSTATVGRDTAIAEAWLRRELAK